MVLSCHVGFWNVSLFDFLQNLLSSKGFHHGRGVGPLIAAGELEGRSKVLVGDLGENRLGFCLGGI